MKLISLIRHKNGKRYFPRLISQLKAISDAIVFLDDNSTDGSYEELNRLALGNKDFHVIRRPGGDFSGGKDWNYLYDYVGKLNPDFLYTPDTDELIEEGHEKDVRNLAEESGKDVLGWSFPFYYLWNDEQHYRNDGPYHDTKVIRLIRYLPDYYPPTRATHATAVSDLLDRRMIRLANVRMVHFGYMRPEDRKVKYDFYTSRDQDPESAGSGGRDYSHMINCPLEIPTIPSYSEWKRLEWKEGLDCLSHCAYRLSVGGFFPGSEEVDLPEVMSSLFDGRVFDEARLSYFLDGMILDKVKETIKRFYSILRPGGRFEAIATNYVNVCRAFADGNHDTQVELQNRFFLTPRKEPLKNLFTEDILSGLMKHFGFENVQSVPVPGLPFRLYMIGYKPGRSQW